MSRYFGFVQLELPGTIVVPDGRYISREGGEGGLERVLVIETLSAPAPPARRRRQPRESDPGAAIEAVPVTRATAVFAYRPFESGEEAARWLAQAVADEETVDAALAEGAALLDRAIHAGAVASADPRPGAVDPERALRIRIGFGSGEEVASGRFSAANDIDPRAGGRPGRRRRREAELQPQERLAALLGGRERADSCETLLLRARADLDAGRYREAAPQLAAAIRAMRVELAGALQDPGHERDMEALEARAGEADAAAEEALRGDLGPGAESTIRDLTELAERILRRRRILRG